MRSDVTIVELQSEREIQRHRLTALETERELTSSPSKRYLLEFQIRTQRQHLFDINAVLDARQTSRHF
jgi:hypothetical protein